MGGKRKIERGEFGFHFRPQPVVAMESLEQIEFALMDYALFEIGHPR